MEKERWLASYLKAAAKAPERGVIPYLALMSGDGLLAAKSEADKLILYTEGKTAITMEDARDIVSGGSIAGVFDLSDRMADVYKRQDHFDTTPNELFTALLYHNYRARARR